MQRTTSSTAASERGQRPPIKVNCSADRTAESRDSGFDAFGSPRNDGALGAIRNSARGGPCGDQFACAAGTLISVGRMIAAAITKRQSAAKVCSMVTKPPLWYSHATRPTETPAAVKPTK